MKYENLEDPSGLTGACLIIRLAVEDHEAQDPEWRERLCSDATTFALGYSATDRVGVDFYIDPSTSSGEASGGNYYDIFESEALPSADEANPLLDRNSNLDLLLNEVLAEPADSIDIEAKRLSTQLINAVDIGCLSNLRDLIAIGKKGVLKLGKIGQGSLPLLEAKITALGDPTLEWKEKPGIEDWLKLYTYAEEIPAIVVGYQFDARVKLGNILSMSERKLAEELYYQDQFGRDRIKRTELPPAEPQEGHYRRARLLQQRGARVIQGFRSARRTALEALGI